MATTYNLTRRMFYNPYYFGGREIESIIFYNDTGIIIDTELKWLGSNNRGQLDEIPLRKHTKPPKKPRYHYVLQNKVYLYAPILDFKYLGEQVRLAQETETSYINQFSFDGAIYNCAYVTRIVLTEHGEKVKAVGNLLRSVSNRVRFDDYIVEKLFETGKHKQLAELLK